MTDKYFSIVRVNSSITHAYVDLAVGDIF